jgi:ABC-type Zn2+ transport system substrate-binding protein/surface adhesin
MTPPSCALETHSSKRANRRAAATSPTKTTELEGDTTVVVSAADGCEPTQCAEPGQEDNKKMHTCIRTRDHAHTHAQTQTQTHRHKHTNTHARMHKHRHKHTNTHTRTNKIAPAFQMKTMRTRLFVYVWLARCAATKVAGGAPAEECQ